MAAVPPGLISPAAFPFTPASFGNDAPQANAPYLIAQSVPPLATGGGPYTVTPLVSTKPGDTIVICCAYSLGAVSPGSNPTDTQNNSYVMVQERGAGVGGSQWICPNPRPLTAGTDVITVPGNGFGPLPQITVMGCPAACLGRASPYLVLDQTICQNGAAGSGGGVFGSSGNGLALVNSLKMTASPELVIAFVIFPNGCGEVIWQPHWNVMTCFGSNGTGWTAEFSGVGWYIATGRQSPQVNWIFGPGGSGEIVGMLTSLMPAFDVAPNTPAPLMPPGMASPGAWQYAPAFTAPRPGTAYNSGTFVAARDSAYLTDTTAGLTVVPPADTAHLTDAASGPKVAAADTGHLSDTFTRTAVVITDTARFTDAAAGPGLAAADTGHLTDTAAGPKVAPPADTAHFTDTASGPRLGAADTAHLTDATGGIALRGADSAHLAEGTPSRALGVPDTAHLTDTAPRLSVAARDTARLADILTALAVPAADMARLAEAIPLAAIMAADSGNFADAGSASHAITGTSYVTAADTCYEASPDGAGCTITTVSQSRMLTVTP